MYAKGRSARANADRLRMRTGGEISIKLRAFQRLVLDALLHVEEIRGYDVHDYVAKRWLWTPSYGSIYAVLYAFEEKGLVTREEQPRPGSQYRQHVYRITPAGRSAIYDEPES
jgi:DNA-binding PadR family transcriptional regulator